jgi:hypothetical protein
LQTQTNDPSEEWKGTEREVVVFSELKKAVEDEDFKDFDRYFSQENIALLSVKEYEQFHVIFVKKNGIFANSILDVEFFYLNYIYRIPTEQRLQKRLRRL